MSQFSVNHLLKLRRPADGTPFDSSPDGSQLAIDLSWGEEAVRRVVVVDTDTGVYRFPFGEETIARCPQWAPDGNSLAAYIQVESNFYPGVWNRLEDTWYLLENVRLAEPEWGFAVPRWTPDSRSVVVKLASVAEEISVDREYGPAAIPNVKIQAFDPNAVAEAGSVLPAWMQEDRGDLARVDVKTGQIRVLTTDWIVRSWRVSPDGRAVATMRMVGRDDVKGANISDLMVIPLDGRKVRQVASGIAQSYATAYSWSPDSRHLAYVTGGSLFLVPSNGTRHPINISGKANGKLRNADPRVHLPPRWSSDGRTVYYPVYGGLWTLAVDGSTQRKYDAGSIDRQMLYWLQPPDGNHPVMADNQTIHVSVLDTESKNHGIARLDLESGRLTLVHERSCAFSDTSMHMETIGDGSAAFLALETAENPPEIWKFSRSSGEFRRFYVPNDDLDQVDMGKARLIEWEDGNGKPGKAALMLPPGYKDGETVPVVVLVYAGDDYSDYIHYFGFGGTYIDNAQLLTGRGYAVLCPDIPLIDGDYPMRQIPGRVVPAVNKLINMGIADLQRIGVYGFSYGAYSVLSLLVQTDIFRAGVSDAPIANLTSSYAQGDWYWFENYQGRMGGTPWEQRDAYIENSPFFFLDRVSAPLLLLSGTEDRNATLQAEEVFSALRRLGSKVEWRSYQGKGHDTEGMTPAMIVDYCNAVLDWFDQHLTAVSNIR